jgi:group II intron reverse transcriptase/maturase
MVLETYDESQFSDHAHGFRPGRGCHTALLEIKRQWTGTKWCLEGDIKGCFDHIDHEVLLDLLGEKIKDNRLMKLLRHMLKAGYMASWKYHQTYSGAPQGGVLSPFLANVYLHELDRYIETELMPRYNRGKKRAINPTYARQSKIVLTARQKGEVERARIHRKIMHTLPQGNPMDPAYRRLRYVRYADDFILGFAGPKAEAEQIKREIGQFLKDRLKLEMAEDKTLTTHATSKPARFLGYHIHVAHNDSYQKKGVRRGNGLVQRRVPYEVRQRWIAKYTKNGKPISRAGLLVYADYDIVTQYGTELRGITNYYCLAVNVGKLYRLKHIMMASLTKTLAEKHKTRVSTIYKQHATVFESGVKGILVEVQRDGKPSLCAKFGEQPIRYRKMVGTMEDVLCKPKYVSGTQLISRLQAEQCELCGKTERVQVHHIRKLADIRRKYRQGEIPPWVAKMSNIHRKTLMVCQQCHRAIHNGQYDGPAISSRRAG